MRKPGCIEPVVYYVNGTDPAHAPGFHMLAPYSDHPTPEGYRREGADTLAEVDKLEAILQQQEREAMEREVEQDEAQFTLRRQAVRDKLYARMTSSDTSEYEKEFIRNYLQLRNERKPKYRALLEQWQMYMWARHNDIGKGRGAGEEVFNPERHTVR